MPMLETHNKVSLASVKPYVIALYRSGKSTVEISKMFGVSSEAVRRFLQRIGIRRRTTAEAVTKHTLNHDYFSHITTHEQAYWLGVLLARGAIYNSDKHGRMVMCPVPLHKRELLVEFAGKIGSSRALYRFRSGDRVSLVINSSNWIGDLKRLGWYEYRQGNEQYLFARINPLLHKSVEAGIKAASE